MQTCSITVTVQDSSVSRGWLDQFGDLVLIRQQDIAEYNQIAEALQTRANTGMIPLYEVKGEPCFCFPKVDEHLRIRAKKTGFRRWTADAVRCCHMFP